MWFSVSILPFMPKNRYTFKQISTLIIAWGKVQQQKASVNVQIQQRSEREGSLWPWVWRGCGSPGISTHTYRVVWKQNASSTSSFCGLLREVRGWGGTTVGYRITEITTRRSHGELESIPNAQRVKAWGGWATTAEEHIRSHFCIQYTRCQSKWSDRSQETEADSDAMGREPSLPNPIH